MTCALADTTPPGSSCLQSQAQFALVKPVVAAAVILMVIMVSSSHISLESSTILFAVPFIEGIRSARSQFGVPP
jgi:hypothetical protein